MIDRLFKNKSIVFKASIIYVIVGFLNKAIGIITIPLFTRILSTSEMGVSTTYISWQTMLYPITSLSIVSGSLFIAMKEFQNERDKYESSVLSLSTVVTMTVFIIYLLFHDFFNRLFTLPTEIMVFMFICLLFQPALDMWIIRQRYEYHVGKMALVTIASNIGSAIVSVLFVLAFIDSDTDLGVVRILGTYGTILVFALFLYALIIYKGRTFYDKKYWGFAIKLSLPLMFHTMGKNILDVSDRSMIAIQCGKSDAGIYGTIYSVASLALIVWTAINNAFVPYLFEKLDKNSDKDIHDINRITMAMLLLFASVSIFLTAIAPEIVKILMTDSYYEAVYLIPAITGGVYMTCVYNIFSNVVLYYEKPIYIMYGTVAAAIINIILNYAGIKQWGYQTAAYTTLITCIILSIVQGLAMYKVRSEKLYDLKMIIIISFGTIATSLLFDVLYNYKLLRYLVIAVILSLIVYNKNKFKSLFFEMKEAKKSV